MNIEANTESQQPAKWRITRKLGSQMAPHSRLRQYLATPTSGKKVAALNGAPAERLTAHGHVTSRLRFVADFGRWMPENIAAVVGGA